MNRYVVCGVCTLKVSECELFDHLVKFHNWKLISISNDASVKNLNRSGQLQKKTNALRKQKIKNKKLQ